MNKDFWLFYVIGGISSWAVIKLAEYLIWGITLFD